MTTPIQVDDFGDASSLGFAVRHLTHPANSVRLFYCVLFAASLPQVYSSISIHLLQQQPRNIFLPLPSCFSCPRCIACLPHRLPSAAAASRSLRPKEFGKGSAAVMASQLPVDALALARLFGIVCSLKPTAFSSRVNVIASERKLIPCFKCATTSW